MCTAQVHGHDHYYTGIILLSCTRLAHSKQFISCHFRISSPVMTSLYYNKCLYCNCCLTKLSTCDWVKPQPRGMAVCNRKFPPVDEDLNVGTPAGLLLLCLPGESTVCWNLTFIDNISMAVFGNSSPINRFKGTVNTGSNCWIQSARVPAPYIPERSPGHGSKCAAR